MCRFSSETHIHPNTGGRGRKKKILNPTHRNSIFSLSSLSFSLSSPPPNTTSPPKTQVVEEGTILTVTGRFYTTPFGFEEMRAPHMEIPLASVKARML